MEQFKFKFEKVRVSATVILLVWLVISLFWVSSLISKLKEKDLDRDGKVSTIVDQFETVNKMATKHQTAIAEKDKKIEELQSLVFRNNYGIR